MTKKSMSQCLRFGTLVMAVTAAFAASPAKADRVVCGGGYQPGLLAFIAQTMTRTTTECAYQGEYMVKQSAVYTGPAVVAAQPTYSPTPAAAGYPYVHGSYNADPSVGVESQPRVYRSAPPRRVVKRVGPVRRVVNVKNDLPPRKGAPQIVHARAEVKIYGPERMDIRLYRR
jgi:hypothetical protein